ncbi:FAD-dependent monooxygenase [Actinoplanes sp. LDG1-06]|uniref:FAD-dependent monooxygenase n=1 Tax=Paractinoplanes ovalisporus TaxID=2810368 RepID=A0ABS2ARK4_9ACTN|nr:FAD-dependent monooxygenase [Actinoplanes ovalisporus]MBM2622441.1 FAD-dependent monooxygenase [Actinoplanes ovalisporus]
MDYDYDVIIAGCGPVGALLASELRLHNIRVLIAERDTTPTSAARIVGLHARTLEILAMRNLLERIVEHGRRRPGGAYFAAIPSPAPATDSPYDFLLGIKQPDLVQILETHATTQDAHIRRGSAVTAIEQHDSHVTAQLNAKEHVTARYFVGCDGAHSTTRKLLQIDFPGDPSTADTLMGEVQVTLSPDEIRSHIARLSTLDRRFSLRPTGDAYQLIIPTDTTTADRKAPPTLQDFQHHLRALAGTDFGIHSPRWLSRFGNATRQAATYRTHRSFLAGDAAHIHPPIGGQGLNLGLQDAFNLGWKLAASIAGWAPEDLLDTYHSERHPVAAAVLDITRAQAALMADTPSAQTLRRLFTDLMALDDVNRVMTARTTATDIRYNFGPTPDPVGRRIPDQPLQSGHLYDHFHSGRPLLLDPTGALTLTGWTDRVTYLADPTAQATPCLIRPDGHIAWQGTSQLQLNATLSRWFTS